MKTTKKLLGLLSLAFAVTHLNAQHGVLDNTFGTGGYEENFNFVSAIAPKANGGYEALYSQLSGLEASANSGGFTYYNYGFYETNAMNLNQWTSTVNLGGTNTNRSVYQPQDIVVRPDGQVIAFISQRNLKDYALGTNASITSPVVNPPFIQQPTAYAYNTNGTSVILNQHFPNNVYGSNVNVYVRAALALPDNRVALTMQLTDHQTGTGLMHLVLRPDLTLDTAHAIRSVAGYGTTGIPNKISNGILRQPDGKLLYMLLDSYGEIMRRHPNGNRDSSFGVNSIASASGMSGINSAISMALQADGKIVQLLAPSTVDSLKLIRMTANGTIDSTFGLNGMLKLRPAALTAGNVYPGALEAQSDGKLLITFVHYASSGAADNRAYLARLNANGSYDNTFGTNGVLTLPFSAPQPNSAQATDIDIAADGKIYAAVSWYLTTGYAPRTVSGGGQPFGDRNLGVTSRVYRVLSGLVVTAVDFVQTTAQPEAMIYPNPVAETFTLSYELSQNSDLNLSLMDMQGRTLHTFPTQTAQSVGKYSQQYDLPQGLTAGNYILRVQTQQGQAAVQITIP